MSSSPADLVREFHLAFGLDARTTPTEVAPDLAAHRGELLAEEAAEVTEVSVSGPLDRLAHELADVVYVAYGTALVHGFDLDAVIAEIHRANMTKIGPDGEIARRADGKVLKGSTTRRRTSPGCCASRGGARATSDVRHGGFRPSEESLPAPPTLVT